MQNKAHDKYLKNYAEQEYLIVNKIENKYSNAVIIPAYNEGESLLILLEQIRNFHAEKVIVILLVNAHDATPQDVIITNQCLLKEIQHRYVCCWQEKNSTPMTLYQLGKHDLLIVDRNQPHNLLRQKEGVGMARKIASDIAFALYYHDKLATQWIHSTDADVVLPDDYFLQSRKLEEMNAAAAIYAFCHQVMGCEQQQKAMLQYDLALDYYVQGLQFAASPYAFHTIGSTFVFNADCYAKIRGFPKRAAGEDFYFLNKLAKQGEIVQLHGDKLIIQGRLSDRVPFGTGHALHKILNLWQLDLTYCYYHPRVFLLLKFWLQLMSEITLESDCLTINKELGFMVEDEQEKNLIIVVLQQLGFFTALEKLQQQNNDINKLQKQLVIWFDAFRTLKFIHALRDNSLASISRTSLLEHDLYENIITNSNQLNQVA